MKLVSSFPTLVTLMVTLLLGRSAAFLSPTVVQPSSSSGTTTTTTFFVPTAFHRETNHIVSTPTKQAIASAASSTTTLNFSENCEVMLDTVCGTIPWPFRKAVRNKFVKELQGLDDDEVAETHVYQVVLKLTPSDHHQKTVELLDQFKMAAPAN